MLRAASTSCALTNPAPGASRCLPGKQADQACADHSYDEVRFEPYGGKRVDRGGQRLDEDPLLRLHCVRKGTQDVYILGKPTWTIQAKQSAARAQVWPPHLAQPGLAAANERVDHVHSARAAACEFVPEH